MPAVGDVILFYCDRINPPHDKFAVCVDARRHWYFFINSRPRRAAEAQVPIRTFELGCLDHDSWIDTSAVQQLTADEVAGARPRGALTPAVRIRVRQTVERHDILTDVLRRAVIDNLRAAK